MTQSRLEQITEGFMNRVFPDGNRPPAPISDEKFVSREYTDEDKAREEAIAQRIGHMLSHE